MGEGATETCQTVNVKSDDSDSRTERGRPRPRNAAPEKQIPWTRPSPLRWLRSKAAQHCLTPGACGDNWVAVRGSVLECGSAVPLSIRYFTILVLLISAIASLAGAPDGILPLGKDGKALNLDFEDGTLKDW